MNPIVAQAIAARASKGLVLTFAIPGQEGPFTCFPKDEAQKQAWLTDAQTKGWTRL